jgi:hypothetical protein
VRIDFANRLVSGVIFMLEAHAFPTAGVVEYGHVSRGQMSASFVRRSSLTMTPFSVVKLIALASSMVGSVPMPATTADVQKKAMRFAYKQKLSI